MNKMLKTKVMSAIDKKTRNELRDELRNNTNINELKKLLEDFSNEGKLQVWSNQKTFSVNDEHTDREAIKFAITWCCFIRHGIINNSALRRLWNINSKLCIARIVGSIKAAEWLENNLTDKMREVLIAA